MVLLRHTSFNIHRIPLILVSVFLLAFMASCKKDAVEIMDLKFPLDTYYVSEGDEVLLYINSGNRKYSLSVGDEELIESTLNASDWPGGSIWVKGLKKGSTELTVKDDVSKQEVVLQIHVVDPYLVMKAVHLIPVIEGTDYETDKAIRNKVKEEKQDFTAIDQGEILILRRNADHQFSIFKNEADVERGIVYKSGSYSLGFYYGGPNRLALYDDDSEDIVEFSIHAPNEGIFLKLLEFSRNDPYRAKQMAVRSTVQKQSVNGLKVEIPQSTSPVQSYSFYLIKDFTMYFQAIYPDVKRVELFQAMDFYPAYPNLNFGEGVLK